MRKDQTVISGLLATPSVPEKIAAKTDKVITITRSLFIPLFIRIFLDVHAMRMIKVRAFSRTTIGSCQRGGFEGSRGRTGKALS